MSAHLASLARLVQNVRAEVALMRGVPCGQPSCQVCAAAERLLEHLAADEKEVRADVDAIFDRNGEPW